MKLLLNTVQYEVVPAPNEGDEVQQPPQDQPEARTGGSGLKRSNRAPGQLARVRGIPAPLHIRPKRARVTRFVNVFT